MKEMIQGFCDNWTNDNWPNDSWPNDSWPSDSWLNESWLNESWLNESWLNESWLNESWLNESWLNESWPNDSQPNDNGLNDNSARNFKENAAVVWVYSWLLKINQVVINGATTFSTMTFNGPKDSWPNDSWPNGNWPIDSQAQYVKGYTVGVWVYFRLLPQVDQGVINGATTLSINDTQHNNTQQKWLICDTQHK